MDTDNNYKVTIIIPAKNEEKTIGGVLDRLLLDFSADRIVVIIDGIADRTAEIAKQKNVKVIEGNGKGKGAAIKIAINAIQSGIFVFMDADGSHKPEDIPKLIQPIVDNTADLVIASRIKAGSEELSGSISNIIRFIGNIASSFIINLFWAKGKIVITDCQNGFRAIRGVIAEQLDLKEDSFAIEQEMVITCLKKGFKIIEVPSYELKRQYGKSHLNSILMLPTYIRCFIRNIG